MARIVAAVGDEFWFWLGRYIGPGAGIPEWQRGAKAALYRCSGATVERRVGRAIAGLLRADRKAKPWGWRTEACHILGRVAASDRIGA